MPAWPQLLKEYLEQPDDAARIGWLQRELQAALRRISSRRDSNVLLYGSSFLQKPKAPSGRIQITHEDLNGYMSVLYSMDWNKSLTLILHTSGGVINATESVVEYLRTKFSVIEVIVPTLAMSAGTMIALAGNRVVMGRQSQLGPIDPQMPFSGRHVSARAIVDQFDRAKREIKEDIINAHVWAPSLASLGPSLIQEAQNALDYGEQMVRKWLNQFMFSFIADEAQRCAKAKSVAKHFSDAKKHKSHGRRIDREEAREAGVYVEDLELDQELQDDVLTAYHLMTIMFEQTPITKVLWAHHGMYWVKNWVPTTAS